MAKSKVNSSKQVLVDPIVLNSRLYRSHIAVLDAPDLVRFARELEIARRHPGAVIRWDSTDVNSGIAWNTVPFQQSEMWARVNAAVRRLRHEKGCEFLCRHDIAELEAMPAVTEPQLI